MTYEFVTAVSKFLIESEANAKTTNAVVGLLSRKFAFASLNTYNSLG